MIEEKKKRSEEEKQGFYDSRQLTHTHTHTHTSFSIITVVYNGAAHLQQAIDSVREQNYPDIEYIVIDGSSTDGTLDIIKKNEDIISYWISEPDKGIFDAMNKGIQKSTHQFIAFLNADDWYEPSVLQTIKKEILSIQDSLENHVIYCDYYSFDEELSSHEKAKCTSELKYWKGMTLSHQSMFVHRSVYQRLGFFDLQYRYACDYEYLLRMITARVEFRKVDFYGVNFRQGGASTKNMNRSISEVSRIVRKYFGVFSREYVLFLMTNRMPSMIGNVRRLLSKTIGNQRTIKLRRIWHRIKGRNT